jgi:hypothetical protein
MRRWSVLLLVVTALLLSGCASSSVASLPAPPTTVSPVSTTSEPNLVGGYLEPVPGISTTTTAALGPGTSTLAGVVTGPSGPVPGAVVQLQRVTAPGSPPATDELASLADGSWRLAGVLGGVYRIRAWRPPNLALVDPITVFVTAGETRQVQMQLQQYSGTIVSSSMAPRPPVVGQPSNLVVQVTTTSVDGAGIVRAVPVTGAMIYLSGSSEWTIEGENPTTTDASGQAAWQLICGAAGSQPLSVTVGGSEVQAIDSVGSCEAPASGTTSS